MLLHSLLRSLVASCTCPDPGSNPPPRRVGTTLQPEERPAGLLVFLPTCQARPPQWCEGCIRFEKLGFSREVRQP